MHQALPRCKDTAVIKIYAGNKKNKRIEEKNKIPTFQGLTIYQQEKDNKQINI